jgi:hypothetical protein
MSADDFPDRFAEPETASPGRRFLNDRNELKRVVRDSRPTLLGKDPSVDFTRPCLPTVDIDREIILADEAARAARFPETSRYAFTA